MYQEFLQYELKDSQMDVNLLSQYQLVINIADTGIVFFVSDVANQKCLAIEKYKFTTTATPDNLTMNLQNIWASHPYLNAGYWKSVVLVFSNLKFAYVPKEYIKGDINPEIFSRYNFKVDSGETLAHYRLDDLSAYCYYSTNNEVMKWFGEFYPSMITKTAHNTNAFLQGLLSYEKKANHIHVNIADSILTLVNIKEGRLIYLNSFSFTSPDDVLYLCTLVADELKLDTRDVKLNIWGDISKDDEYFNKLKPYFQQVTSGKRPQFLKFSFNFDELEDQLHFDLFNAAKLYL